MKCLAPIFAALLVTASGAWSQATPVEPRPGDRFEFKRETRTETLKSEHSTGSSFGRDVIVQQIIAVRPDGLELEYDQPDATSPEDRAREWKLPARVLKRADGTLKLLNAPELEVRLDAWLAKAKWPREICGRWIFTWNAFKIECDPQVVLPILADFDPQPPSLADGALYSHPGALAAAPMRRIGVEGGLATYRVELTVDANWVRREQAEADVVVGEILRKPVTFEAALAAHQAEEITGTTVVTFQASDTGVVQRRTVEHRLEIRGADKETESRKSTEILERRALGPKAPD
jgi:hypothetical protein